MQKIIEQARQSLHVGERTFKPTPNLRNPAMLAEAEDFATHMTTFKTNVRRYQAHLQAFLRCLPVVARGNLPRVWERVPGGLCEPLRPNVSHAFPTRVGGEFDEGLLHDARDMLDAQLSQDIIKPIDRWLESLQVVKSRMRKLEGLRLDVDARRRRVHRRYMRALERMERREANRAEGGRGRHRRSRSVGGGDAEDTSSTSSSSAEEEDYELSYGGAAGEDDLRAIRGKEDFVRSSLYYQRKLAAVQATYREQEELVWEHLAGLVRDAAWLKAFVAGTLLTVKDTLQASAVALGHCKLPLPAFPRFNAGGEYGAIGDPAPLIADVPDSIKTAAGPVASPLALMAGGGGAIQSDVAAALRPKRMTAQPLQTSADNTTPRYDPVPPVIRGQPGIPLDELTPAGIEGSLTSGGGAATTTGAAAGGGGGGGIVGGLRELASEVMHAAKQGPVMPAVGGRGETLEPAAAMAAAGGGGDRF
ncbi:hypothetical protein PLESTB_000176600 [Pleodorina starrii]|uniref:Uncharacterized protein n=1 Tax=Pleodorina starrii TaxID=330485 RepID=A0A9W6BBE7_9CHLO|nr:hypothetical protein PLESTB_000176600 [Pleodorina starrii]GLC66160.1 hypothetical protein PLESTF_000391400 [Pleodorina starrii]